MLQRDQEITGLLKKLDENQEKIEEHATTREETKQKLEERLGEIQKSLEDSLSRRLLDEDKCDKLADEIKSLVSRIEGGAQKPQVIEKEVPVLV